MHTTKNTKNKLNKNNTKSKTTSRPTFRPKARPIARTTSRTTSRAKARPISKPNTKKVYKPYRITRKKTNIVMAPYNSAMTGGTTPYFGRILAKDPNEPITAGDMKKAFDEIIAIMNQVKYTKEGRQFNVGTTLLQYFTGDEQALHTYLRYQVMPQYISIFPPSINIPAIISKLGEVSFISNAYLKDEEFKRQALIDSGVHPDDIEENNSPIKSAMKKMSGAVNKYKELRRSTSLRSRGGKFRR